MTSHPCSVPTLPAEDRPLEGAEKTLIHQMIAAIHRPDVLVEQVVVGSKFLAVIAGNRMGLSSLLDAVPKPEEMALIETLVGKPVKSVVTLFQEPSAFLICLGAAALNAANAPDPESVEASNFPAENLIAQLGKEKITGLVGEFPFAKQLAQKVGTFHLFELKPLPNRLPRNKWETTLPRLDVLAITATTLLTRQMAWYLSRAPQAKIVILGPTTPNSTVLFEYGANYLCGSVVTDMARVAASIKSGLCFKDIKKKGGIIFTRQEP